MERPPSCIPVSLDIAKIRYRIQIWSRKNQVSLQLHATLPIEMLALRRRLLFDGQRWIVRPCGSRQLLRNTTSSRLSSTQSPNEKQDTLLHPYVQGDHTHFGYVQVPIDAKEEHVRHVFENVADSYDVMNDLMSGGLHRVWKDHLLHVSSVGPIATTVRRICLQPRNPAAPPAPVSPLDEGSIEGDRMFKILDVAGGTGDVAFRFVEAAGCLERSKSSGLDPIQITVCDINQEMLRVGEQRARKRYGNAVLDSSRALCFRQGNAQSLHELDDNSFDLYTIAFGLRNVTDVDKALHEAWRVLKPGGRFLCLEFSQVTNPLLRNLYDQYSFSVIPALGDVVAGDRASYQYLVESIRKFPNQQELLERLQRAGFQKCQFTNLTFGVVALHEGWKPL
jgi:2-methoxy-6-polyprenyl-1,4-benzoquinol methylase